MTTLAKIKANQQNGRRSTGPKTPKGKAAAKMNAVAHGLRSLSPVLSNECPKEWAAHRAGVVSALAPVGTLEAELAERVALLTWRLRRVVRYETAVTSAGINSAIARVRGEKDEDNPLEFIPLRRVMGRTYATVSKELEAARANADTFGKMCSQFCKLSELPADHRFEGGEAIHLLREIDAYSPNGDEEYLDFEDHGLLADMGVPEEWQHEAGLWDGWTAERVQAGVKVIAETYKLSPEELLRRAIRGADQTAIAERQKVRKLEMELAQLAESTAEVERVAHSRALLPTTEVLDKVMRYESHLNKQLTQTLHTLERLWAIREGNPPSPPAALDVTVEAGALMLAQPG